METTQEMAPSGAVPVPYLEMPVDAEHGGIRLAGCAAFLGTSIVATLIFNIIISGFLVIAIMLGIVAAAGVTYLLDRTLKGNWPSGRKLIVHAEQILLSKDTKVERSVDPTKQVNPLLWRFEVKRSSRVKKGWYVVAMSLEQDGEHLPIYTFCSPEDFEKLPASGQYSALTRPDRDAKRSSERDMRLAGQQRRLHEAEMDRGMSGAELSLEQYIECFDTLQAKFPKWMPRD